jgi:hypothetical protein
MFDDILRKAAMGGPGIPAPRQFHCALLRRKGSTFPVLTIPNATQKHAYELTGTYSI